MNKFSQGNHASDACGGDVLPNRCLSGTFVCGVSAKCTSGTTVAVCLDQFGNTPGSSNTVATCKVIETNSEAALWKTFHANLKLRRHAKINKTCYFPNYFSATVIQCVERLLGM